MALLMPTPAVEDRLSVLLLETGKAHHRAYIETDGYDPEWPLWYAAHLQPRLRQEFGLEMTQSDLVYWLVGAEKQRLAASSQLSWPDFYARQWRIAGLFG
jgi:hypothetical protein